MPNSEDILYSVALTHSGLSSAVLIRLVAALGSAKAVWESSSEAFQNHLKPAQLTKLLDARACLRPESLLSQYQAMGARILLLGDLDYPPLLRESHDPPFVLYVRGNVKALSHPKTLAIVGTRAASMYGFQVVEKVVSELKDLNPCIVSGLAAGIDTQAHHRALHYGLPTVAVFGTPLDVTYPAENGHLIEAIVDSGGAVITESPLGAYTDRSSFPRRNRVIAGLCQGTLVVEAPIKSGALITAKEALSEGRVVMAVPGDIFQPSAQGPNQLIDDGAPPIRSGDDVALALKWKEPSSKKKTAPPPVESFSSGEQEIYQALLAALSPEEREVYLALKEGVLSFDVLQGKLTSLSVGQIQTALTILELHGLIRTLPGAKYTHASSRVSV